MLRKFLATNLALISILFSSAQAPFNIENDGSGIVPDSVQTSEQEKTEEVKPAWLISGSADVYYRYDFNQQASNNKTSFTNSYNSFELGMASLRVSHSFGKAAATADLGFGKRAEEFSYNDKNTQLIIKQLYLSYDLAKDLKITAGSWATHVGCEVVDAAGNRNYSMSYMFSYGPFFHTGIKAEYTKGNSGFMVGIANPTDFKSALAGSKKYFIGQYSLSSEDQKLKAYLNLQAGKRISDTARHLQTDVVITYKLNDKFSFCYNGTLTELGLHTYSLGKEYRPYKSWWGSALYFNYDPKDIIGFTLRTEYFSDKNSLVLFGAYPNGGNILAATLSANIKKNALTIIPEVRFEKSNQPLYLKKDGSTGIQIDFSALIAAVYKF